MRRILTMVILAGVMVACGGAEVPTVERQSQVLQLADDRAFGLRVDVPVGWEQTQRSSSIELQPGPEADFNNATTMNVGTGCAGRCVAQDWQALLEANPDAVRPRTPDSAVLVSREELSDPEGFVMVFDVDELFFADRHIVVARWDDTASRFFECFVGLGGSDVDLSDDFVQICTTAEPEWFGAES